VNNKRAYLFLKNKSTENLLLGIFSQHGVVVPAIKEYQPYVVVIDDVRTIRTYIERKSGGVRETWTFVFLSCRVLSMRGIASTYIVERGLRLGVRRGSC
jgi:hypothetical protein